MRFQVSRTAISALLICARLSTHSSLFQSKMVTKGCSSVTYMNTELSKRVDDRLMVVPGYSIDQLMELAGYSVASAVLDYYQLSGVSFPSTSPNVLVYCGPGNNGGDGLVAARHLKQFGFSPSVVYPKRGKSALFANLLQQMVDMDIPVLDQSPSETVYASNELVVDALFGFSCQGPSREPFTSMIQQFARSKVPVIAVDIPSGWDVDSGDVFNSLYMPKAVISLTAPKLCMRGYTGVHYVGGRYF